MGSKRKPVEGYYVEVPRKTISAAEVADYWLKRQNSAAFLAGMLPEVIAIGKAADAGVWPSERQVYAVLMLAVRVASRQASNSGYRHPDVADAIVHVAALTGTNASELLKCPSSLEWTVLLAKCRAYTPTPPAAAPTVPPTNGKHNRGAEPALKLPEDSDLRDLWHELHKKASNESDREVARRSFSGLGDKRALQLLNNLQQQRKAGKVSDWR